MVYFFVPQIEISLFFPDPSALGERLALFPVVANGVSSGV